MSPRYSPPSVEVIQEASEDDVKEEKKGREAGRVKNDSHSERQESHCDSIMSPMRSSADRAKDKGRKSHRSSTSSSLARHSKSKHGTSSSKHPSIPIPHHEISSTLRRRHRRTLSHPSGDSSSSSDEEPIEDHRAVLAAARSRLTSPSVISTSTSLTTATNNSGGSSSSNSTVTQASMSNCLSPSRRSESKSELPMSPAVPDAPNVFAYLDEDDDDDDDDDDDAEAEAESGSNKIPSSPWLPPHLDESYEHDLPTPKLLMPKGGSLSSSVSSNFHSDDASERLGENDTDRSTSPEQSVRDSDEERPLEAVPASPTANKLASQLQAARQRQHLHNQGAFQSFGTPQMPRGPAVYPHIPAISALSPREQHQMQPRALPRAGKIPITGYEALASALANSTRKENGIPPIYRKFELLNHRLLLQLQDELSELEEQLHRLDNADTQSRSVIDTAHNSELLVQPASRRLGAQMGGDLEWHKADLVARIAYKMAQYNSTLSSFNSTQTLQSADEAAVEKYREYLAAEKPVVDAETRFLDATGDLVILGPSSKPKVRKEVRFSRTDQEMMSAPPQLFSLAIAIAAAVLVPILTFAVIPGFIGRMTVVMLVALGIMGAMVQSGVAGRDLVGTEGAVCVGIYGIGMMIIAGVVA